MEENRVEKALRQWAVYEKRLKEQFGSEIVNQPYYEKMRLEVYRETYHQLKNSARNDEKPMLFVLKGEINRMEKRLYPSTAIRLFRSIGRALKSIPKEKLEAGEIFKLEIQEKMSVKATVKAAQTVSPNKVQKINDKKVVLFPKKRIKNTNGLSVK